MPNLGAPELLVVLAIVMLLFGANKIPEIMGGMGQGVKELRKALKEEAPTPAAPAAAEQPKRDIV